MDIEGEWTDLETRGFVVVRNFLPPALLGRAVDDARSSIASGNWFGDIPGMMRAAPAVCAPLEVRIHEAMANVRKHTDLQITDIVPSQALYFSLPNPIWHTDRFPYFQFQDFYQYLNFWMPIVKPKRDDAGLMVVPMDELAKRDRRMYEAVYRRGGAHFIPTNVAANGLQAIFDYLDTDEWTTKLITETLLYEGEGEVRHLKAEVDIEDLAVAPPVVPGDLIIARGDVLHRGQGSSKDRIALSMRAVNGATPVRKDWFLGLSEFSKAALGRPKNPVAVTVLGAFSHHGRDTVSARELLDFRAAVDAKQDPQAVVASKIAANALALLGRSEQSRVSA